MVPGFNKEVKFYKRVTHDDGATETEPTTLDEIMQMEITMVLPPPASVEAGERAEPQARGRVCGGGCRQAAAHLIHTTHTSHTHTHSHKRVSTANAVLYVCWASGLGWLLPLSLSSRRLEPHVRPPFYCAELLSI